MRDSLKLTTIPKLRVQNHSGFTLIEALMALGLLGIVLAGFTAMFSLMNNQTRSLSEKLALADAKNHLISLLSDGRICDFLVKNNGPWTSLFPMTFDSSHIGSSSPPSIALNQILGGPSTTSPVIFEVQKSINPQFPWIVVQGIALTGILGSPSDNEFPATVTIRFDASKMQGSQKPIETHVILRTSGAGNIKTITGCTRVSIGKSIGTTVSNVKSFHSSCTDTWPDPHALHHCLTACSRYCKSVGFSGGTMSEWNPGINVAVCDCNP